MKPDEYFPMGSLKRAAIFPPFLKPLKNLVPWITIGLIYKQRLVAFIGINFLFYPFDARRHSKQAISELVAFASLLIDVAIPNWLQLTYANSKNLRMKAEIRG